jgi:hypothetical protein
MAFFSFHRLPQTFSLKPVCVSSKWRDFRTSSFYQQHSIPPSFGARSAVPAAEHRSSEGVHPSLVPCATKSQAISGSADRSLFRSRRSVRSVRCPA